MTVKLSERWPVIANWRFFLIIALPLILMPICFVEDNDLVNAGTRDERPSTKFKCGYVIIIMSVFWMTEAIPLAVTSFIPIVLFPLLGIQDTSNVSMNYMKETNMMFVGGLIIALSVEYCNLHKRIALKVMSIVGSSPIRLMLGIMLTTMFLSMWISNTATTAMMVPIVLAVLEVVNKDPDDVEKNKVAVVPVIPRTLRTSNAFVEEDKNMEDSAPVQNKAYDANNDGTVYMAMSDEPEGEAEARAASRNAENNQLRRQLLYGVMVAANIGGVFWPYAASTSNVLYRLSRRYYQGVLLGVAYASNLGGTGFITGTAPNLVLMGRIQHKKEESNMVRMYLFAVAFSSNIGGTGALTGTGPNLILNGFIRARDISQNGKYTDLTFATWMAVNVPGMVINVVISWAYLIIVFFGLPDWARFGKKSERKRKVDTSASVNKVLKQKYAELGPMSFHEIAVAILFFMIVMLWLFRDPRFIKGWAEYIPHVEVGDSTAAMLVVIILFIIPRSLNFFSGGSSEPLLDWKFVQDRLPWGLVILMGAGFALSDAADASGLSPWIGKQLNGLEHLDKRIILIIVMLLTAAITEVASNGACANIVIPILLNLSENLKIHPLYLTLPAAISCSYAFMLPVATPPNAIVFGAGKMKILDMVKTGAFLNFSCVIVMFILNITYGSLIFDYDNYEYPSSGTNVTILS